MTIYLNNQPNFTEGRIRLIIGDTLSINLTFKDNDGEIMDLTNYESKLTVRSSPSVTATAYLEFLSTGMSPEIVLDDASPNWRLLIADEITAEWDKGLYYYDLELTDNTGQKRTYLLNTFELITQ